MNDVQSTGVQKTTRRKFAVHRLLIGITMGLALLVLGYFIYKPASLIAGMLTDSCSGDTNVYFFWNLWLRILWAVVLAIGALLPAALTILNLRWRWVLLSLLACGAVSLVWYLLWLPIVMLAC